jgi:mannose-6-phosphate isomerase-like protein (cupin superfamily)
MTPTPVPFAGNVAYISRDFSMRIEAAPPGPPRRIDGYSIGSIPGMDRPAPHNGELHPDGDELLYVVSGRVEVILDDGDQESVGAETTVQLGSGDACIVPRGVWHRVVPVEPSHLIHVTPGPHGPHRPVAR